MALSRLPIDFAKQIIWNFAEQASYALVICRSVNKLWTEFRPKRGMTRGIVFIPGETPEQYVYVKMNLKSTRCTKNKSFYTIQVHSKDAIIWISCSETEVEVTCSYLTGPRQGRWNHPISTIGMNGFEDPDEVWKSVKRILMRHESFNTLCQPSETALKRWSRPPASLTYYKEGGFRCQVVGRQGFVPIDTTNGGYMPAYWSEIQMSANP